jgi:predicted choloylglycine hydrolase
MLSLYCPTPYLTGCSQAIWTRGAPLLARNYDYHPQACEGTILLSSWHGTRVLAMTDCLWGVLDGMNEHGLAVSLSFGGRKVVGAGFGIPLILRYVLEFCTTAAEGVAVLRRVPSHMSYNVSLLDASGAWATVHVAPDRSPELVERRVATNHQAGNDWAEHAHATRSTQREELLAYRLEDAGETPDSFVQGFLRAPLFQRDYTRALGTLYTSVYRPLERSAEYLWPAKTWRQSFAAFDEGEIVVGYRQDGS